MDYTEDNCPDAYAYAYDESSGTALWTCDSGLNADYTLTFCPWVALSGDDRSEKKKPCWFNLSYHNLIHLVTAYRSNEEMFKLKWLRRSIDICGRMSRDDKLNRCHLSTDLGVALFNLECSYGNSTWASSKITVLRIWRGVDLRCSCQTEWQRWSIIGCHR